MELDTPSGLFPPSDRAGARWFWATYVLRACWYLPVVLMHEAVLLCYRLYVAAATRGRSVEVFGGDLRFYFLSFWQSLVTDILFDERFVVAEYKGAVFDPGPRAARRQAEAFLKQAPTRNREILCTHFHEEHIGNAAFLGRTLGAPVYGTGRTLSELRRPSTLPWYREALMGQAEPAQNTADLRELAGGCAPLGSGLMALNSPGHCPGHVSFYDPERKILFAGDSFMGEVFTCPNEDFDATELVGTLQEYEKLDIDVLIEAHGAVYTTLPEVPDIPHLVVRKRPQDAIQSKLRFLHWAKEMVAYGEGRRLDYGVIERCLFGWGQPWARASWLRDTLFRELSDGDFSRSLFLRTLATHPMAVPLRRPLLGRLIGRVGRFMHRHGELLRIHLQALSPSRVLPILLGLALSAVGLELAAAVGNASLTSRAIERPFAIAQSFVAASRIDLLLMVFAWFALIWTTLGGAATRRIALDLLAEDEDGGRGESMLASLRFCLKWPLFVPSGLASICLFLILLSPRYVWLLLPVLPLWLYAGLLYGALVLEDTTLRQAVTKVHKGLRRWRYGAWLQFRFLVGFAISTGVVYATVLLYAAGVLAAVRGLAGVDPDLGDLRISVAMIGPVAVYALGYTTSNLKSLQVYLYTKLFVFS